MNDISIKDSFSNDKSIRKTILFFLLLLVTNFISNRFVMDNINMVTVKNIIGLILLFSCMSLFFKRHRPLFINEIIIIYVGLIFSALSSESLYGQSLIESFKPSMQIVLALSIYLLACKYKLSEKEVLNMLLVISIIYTFIEVFQQLTYPNYWFCGRIEKYRRDVLEMRMGLYRFVLDGIFYLNLSLMLLFSKIIKNKGDKTKLFLLFFVVLIGIIFNVERKIIMPCFLVLLIGLLFSNKMSFGKIIFLFFVFIVISILFQYMGSLNKQSIEEINDPDFIRFRSMGYYAFEMNESPLYYAFGAGIPNNSSLSKLIDYMEDVYHYFQEDVGIVGYMSKFGLLGLVPHILIIAKIFKHWNLIDIGLKLHIIMLLLISYFKFWGNYLPNYAAFALYLYFVEQSILRNKKKQYNNPQLVTRF